MMKEEEDYKVFLEKQEERWRRLMVKREKEWEEEKRLVKTAKAEKEKERMYLFRQHDDIWSIMAAVEGRSQEEPKTVKVTDVKQTVTSATGWKKVVNKKPGNSRVRSDDSKNNSQVAKVIYYKICTFFIYTIYKIIFKNEP